MAVDLVIRQGDTTPPFIAVVTDQNGNPVNLTGATATLVIRQLASSTPLLNVAMTATNAPAGAVSYSWNASDTATAPIGLYMAEIHCTLSSGATYTYPNVGYMQVEIQEALTNPAQQLVSVADVKDVLNLMDLDRVHDSKIMRWIRAARPVIEALTGPIIPTTLEEWHDGGHYSITLWRIPSSALGTSPILIVNAISEYNGPIEWPLAMISSPDEGELYSAQVEVNIGRIVRRTAGGGSQAFPSMPQSVHVWYTAGQSSVPDNVYEGTLEYIRQNYQDQAQALRSGKSRSPVVEGPPAGYAVSYRVREILAANRRYPSLA